MDSTGQWIVDERFDELLDELTRRKRGGCDDMSRRFLDVSRWVVAINLGVGVELTGERGDSS